MLYRNFASQAELDAAYDVEGSVPNMDEYAARFETESARARSELPHELAVRYGPTVDEWVDIYRPSTPADGKRPMVVFLHGGYWKSLTAREFGFAALGLTALDCICVLTTYALAPVVKMDEIVRQSRSSVAWTWHNAERLGGDRNRLFVVGQSAGAHLMAMCVLTDWKERYDLPATIIRGAWGLSGLYDLRPLPFSFIGPSLQLSHEQVWDNSPHLLDLPDNAPPIHMSYGTEEPSEFRRQTKDFHKRWRSAGLDGTLVRQDGHDHFSSVIEMANPRSQLMKALADTFKLNPKQA